jgi:hypothetical protein
MTIITFEELALRVAVAQPGDIISAEFSESMTLADKENIFHRLNLVKPQGSLVLRVYRNSADIGIFNANHPRPR